MAKPEYWNSEEVAKFLGITRLNLRQITFRMTRAHIAMGHKNDRCYHLIVDHSGSVYTGKPGRGKNWFKAEKVMNYSLFRKGEISPINVIVRTERDQRKRSTQKAGLTKGRPSSK